MTASSGEHGSRAARGLGYVGEAAGLTVIVLAAALLAWYGLKYFLLLFLGVLLALLISAPANWIARHTPVPRSAGLAIVGVVLLSLAALGLYFFGSAALSQTLELGERLPQILDGMLDRVREHDWGRRILQLLADGEGKDGSGGKVVGGALKAVGSTVAFVAHFAIVVFFAAFLAAQPRLYVDGALRLLPPARRPRVREVMHAIGEILERWLVGQAVLMLCVAVLTLGGLLLLGVPLALPLALVAGLLNFIPFLGPILGAIPAILVGFSEGPQLALYVAGLFVLVQSIEGYLLEPLVQHRAVYLAPAVILLAQVLLGLVAGPIGVVVATPFAAAVMVAVEKLYVEDVLGDRSAA